MSFQLVWNLSEKEGFWTSQNDNEKGKGEMRFLQNISQEVDISLMSALY